MVHRAVACLEWAEFCGVLGFTMSERDTTRLVAPCIACCSYRLGKADADWMRRV
jgi:hypothetical protein